MKGSRFSSHLRGLSDEVFVHHAFVFHHKRVCDAEQASLYLGRLRSGRSRHTVWNEIRALATVQRDEWMKKTLASVMVLDEEVFVSEAYLVILGRAADPAGLRHYSQGLRKGKTKVEILYSLAASEEAKLRSVKIPALRWLVTALRRESRIDCAKTIAGRTALRLRRLLKPNS